MSTQTVYKWNTLPWKIIRKKVFKLQKRIYQASKVNNHTLIHSLQKLLITSKYAKLLAVRQVTQVNKGKHTPGIDGVKSLTEKQRIKMAANLTLPVKAQPTRRIWIEKPNNPDEKRPLGIPTIKNRCQQALLKMALEPEWEARFEPNSYGFRPARSTHDAIEAIYKMIKSKPKYVLDADISKCFDKINHKALLSKLNTTPEIRRAIKAFLNAGVIDGNALFPTIEGTPQGSIISPLLANIALHGLENHVRDSFPDYYKGNQKWKPFLVRYADDFVILHPDLKVIEKAKTLVQQWLTQFDLELKDSKTRISHTLNNYKGNCGFDFLGFTIRQFPVGKTHSGKLYRPGMKSTLLGFKTIIKPGKKAILKHSKTIREIILKLKNAPQKNLIAFLNPIIKGWCNYYSTVCSTKTFASMKNLMYHKLLKWAVRRHPNKNMKWIVKKYWRIEEEKRWIFATKKENTRLFYHTETAIRRHIKIRGSKSPFDNDRKYWGNRMNNKYRE